MCLTLAAIAKSPVVGGRDLRHAGSGSHGNLGRRPLRQHESAGVYHWKQPDSSQGDGEDWGIPGMI